MAYNSKYTGEEVENLLDQVANGNTGGGGTQVQADWNEWDTSSPSFVKNKPNINQEYQDGEPVGSIVFLSNVDFAEGFTFDSPLDAEVGRITFGDDGIHYELFSSMFYEPASIDIIHTGDGTKFLADDGTYKEASEVELITISGDMLADEPTYTVAEAQSIIDAYNANKLIAIKCGTRINFGKGWFIPNINIRTQSGVSQIFLSGILGNYYIEHRIIYDTSAETISATAQNFIDLSESGGGATTDYVDQAIANAITNTLNTPV